MGNDLETKKQVYADLLIRSGVNLQGGQSLRIGAELAHREFVRQVVAAAYEAGAKYVQLDWIDTPTTKQRFLHSRPDFLDYYPGYEVGRHEYMLAEKWARLALVGPEFPNVFDDVDPEAMRRTALARSKLIKFYMDRTMANDIQWCVAAVPTPAWAKQVFPDLPEAEAVDRLWQTVMETCRVYQPDPVAAWLEHAEALNRLLDFLAKKKVRSVHFVDSRVDDAGKPLTDLTVGLTDHPVWIGAGSATPDGVEFFANMPTEEIFSTPHNQRTQGWARITKPAYPFEREVRDAWFHFEDGEVVEYDAGTGKKVLDELFAIDGARRLGEVALVDLSSPINQSGLLFYETLFDENATCHIAFGNAYPDGVEGGSNMEAEALAEAGVNSSPAHVDVMIGSATMNVTGECADGSTVAIMENGRFVPEATGGV
jgi:aminopeptidase